LCLIIAKPKGVEINNFLLEAIRRGSLLNNDGTGFAFKKNKSKEIVIDKGYWNMHILENKLKSLKLDKDDELIVHCRMSTHGEVIGLNTQPFSVNKSTIDKLNSSGEFPAICHNGIMGDYYLENEKGSDTYQFVDKYLLTDFVKDTFIKDPKKILKTNRFSKDQKFAILSPDKDLITFGCFQEDNGVFFSNSSYNSFGQFVSTQDITTSKKVEKLEVEEIIDFKRTSTFTTLVPFSFMDSLKKAFKIYPYNEGNRQFSNVVLPAKIIPLTDRSTRDLPDLAGLIKDRTLILDKSNFEDFFLEVMVDSGSDKIGQTAEILDFNAVPNNVKIKKSLGPKTFTIEHITLDYLAKIYAVYPNQGHVKVYSDYKTLVTKTGFSKSAYKKLLNEYNKHYKDNYLSIAIKLKGEYTDSFISKTAFRMYLMTAPSIITTIQSGDTIPEPKDFVSNTQGDALPGLMKKALEGSRL